MGDVKCIECLIGVVLLQMTEKKEKRGSILSRRSDGIKHSHAARFGRISTGAGVHRFCASEDQ